MPELGGELMGKMNISGDAVLGLVAELILDEAVRKFKTESLYKQIDSALARGDQASFLALTTELKLLLSRG